MSPAWVEATRRAQHLQEHVRDKVSDVLGWSKRLTPMPVTFAMWRRLERGQSAGIHADGGQEILIAAVCHQDPPPATRRFTPTAMRSFTRELSIARDVLPIHAGLPLPLWEVLTRCVCSPHQLCSKIWRH
jgi:hypothetical protein